MDRWRRQLVIGIISRALLTARDPSTLGNTPIIFENKLTHPSSRMSRPWSTNTHFWTELPCLSPYTDTISCILSWPWLCGTTDIAYRRYALFPFFFPFFPP